MDFLRLVQELHRESGSGGNTPSSVDNLRGEALRLRNWIIAADLEIQELHSDWNFLWAQKPLGLTPDTFLYDALPDGGEYDRDTFVIDGEYSLDALNYIDVKSEPRDNALRGKPHQVVIMPDKTLRFDDTPSRTHVVTFDYWRQPVPLDVGSDESLIPENFRKVIVGRALMLYGMYEVAPEMIEQGQMLYSQWLRRLEASELPGERYMHRKAEGNVMGMYVE